MKRKGNYGHKLDDATRKRISESVKKRWKDNIETKFQMLISMNYLKTGRKIFQKV